MTAVFTPSKYQAAVFEWVKAGSGNAIINAVAGSGKSTTLVEAAKLIGSKTGLFLAFNKHIADELKTRLVGTSMVASTIHSLSKATLEQHLGKRTDPNKGFAKWRELVKEQATIMAVEQDKQYQWSRALEKLIEKVMVTLTDARDEAALWGLVEHFGMEDVTPNMLKRIPIVLDKAEAITRATGQINFNEMIYWPCRWGLQPTKYDWVFVDEAQDLNAMQLEMALRARSDNGRIVFVGDECQPEGTKVTIVKQFGNKWHQSQIEQVKIEDLKVGDRAVSYTQRDCAFTQRGRLVRGITKRPYEGALIVASTEVGHVSKYTPNHRCVASFTALRDKVAVYMMQKGNQFRVGKARMNYAHKGGVTGSGPITRARAENADALWILTTFDTDIEATVMEGAIAGRFGIPELIFTDINESPEGQELLDRAWKFIGENTFRATECLSYFGRDIRFPLYNKETHSRYCSLKRPMIVHASNLMNGMLMLPYKSVAHVKSADWLPIKITHEHYNGYVYSLDVDAEHTYIADGLLTHNCQAIYGFAGADAASFNTIRTRANAQELPLSVNYRCPKSHLALVRDIVPHIEDGPNAIDGLVHFKAEDEIYSLAQPRDYIVCRLNAPLVSTCIKFIQRRKSARVIGRDIGKDLCSLLDKVAEREMFDYAEIVKHLDEYERQQVIMLSQKEGNEQKIESLQDRIECLQVCAGEFGDCDNIDCLKREIEKLFGEEGDVFSGVSLSTVHKAKGLEADRIFVLKPEKLPLKWKNQSGWQYTQELNIRYISLTRAKKELFILGTLPPLTAPLAPPVVVEYEDTRNPLLLEVAGDNGAVQMMPIPNAAPVATAPLKSPILNALRSAKLEEEGCEDKQQPSAPVFNKAAVVEQPAPSAATFKVTGNLNADIKQIETPRARLLALVDQLTLPEINTLIDLLNEAKKAKVEA